MEKDLGSLQHFNHPKIPPKGSALNLSQPHQNTISQSTIKSFKSKQSLKQKIKGSWKGLKGGEELGLNRKFEKKQRLKNLPYSLSLVKNLVVDNVQLEKDFEDFQQIRRSKIQRGKSTELEPAKLGKWATLNTSQQQRGVKKGQLVWNAEGGPRIPSSKEVFKKKKIRFSLNQAKQKALESGQVLKERFFKRLLPKKKEFESKKYSSNLPVNRFGKKESSSLLGSCKKSSKSIQSNSKKPNEKLKAKIKQRPQDPKKVKFIRFRRKRKPPSRNSSNSKSGRLKRRSAPSIPSSPLRFRTPSKRRRTGRSNPTSEKT